MPRSCRQRQFAPKAGYAIIEIPLSFVFGGRCPRYAGRAVSQVPPWRRHSCSHSCSSLRICRPCFSRSSKFRDACSRCLFRAVYTGTRPGLTPAIRAGKWWRGRRESDSQVFCHPIRCMHRRLWTNILVVYHRPHHNHHHKHQHNHTTQPPQQQGVYPKRALSCACACV